MMSNSTTLSIDELFGIMKCPHLDNYLDILGYIIDNITITGDQCEDFLRMYCLNIFDYHMKRR